MFKEVAMHLREALAGWSNVRILNAGAGIPAFYRVAQPFIWTDVMEPLLARGCTLVNLDAKPVDDPSHVTGDAAAMPFEDASFDRVLCLSLLEHVLSPEIVVSEIRRVLKPDGCAVFEVPARFPPHPDPIENFLRMHTETQWKALLAGFETFGFTAIDAPSRNGSCTLIWGKPK